MVKAREENGVITIYPEIPQDWKHYLNFRQAPESVWQHEGFYDLVEPEFDPDLNDLGEIYFDDQWLVFRYYLVQKTLPILDEAKTAKIKQLRNAVKPLYSEIQWYIEMERAEGNAIPTTVLDKIKMIKTKYDLAKNQINALTTVVERA